MLFLGMLPHGMDWVWILLLLSLAVFLGVSWVWALIDCVTKESDQGNSKLIWVLIIVLLHVFGAILYWTVRRPRRLAELGR